MLYDFFWFCDSPEYSTLSGDNFYENTNLVLDIIKYVCTDEVDKF